MAKQKATQSNAIEVAPGPTKRQVRFPDGSVRSVPADWSLLEPGDAGLTRRLKSLGPTWTVKEKKGRRVFSRGVWAATHQIQAAKQSVAADREKPAYAKRKQYDAERREKQQHQYTEDFQAAVLAFLNFHQRHHELAHQLATRVTQHATPVGSGTVARTKRIPIQQRAESAVIAWMRHQTTAYDHMRIARIKGERREVRRQLASQSRKILEVYRRGDAVRDDCPLRSAVQEST